MPVISRIFGEHEPNVIQQLEACIAAEDASVGVLCADGHLGYSMPIGGVVAYRDHVSPSAVGYDIACGNCAVKTTMPAPRSGWERARAMDAIWRTLSFGVGLKNSERVEAAILDEIAECDHPFQKGLALMAAQQFGTIGSGNHYVDLFEDADDGKLWVGVHFGSRGFGHKTASWALEQAGTKDDSMMAPPVVIPISSELGALYVDGMERAGRYAYAARDWVVTRVLALLGASAEMPFVHNHHNFAWRENHHGVDFWVHRKGATPAYPGQRGFVGGTMGDNAVILEGVDTPESEASLYSTVHGAGRVLSRRKASGKTRIKRAWVCRDYRKCDYKGAAGGFRRGPNGETPTCPNCGHKLQLTEIEHVVEPGLVDFERTKATLAGRGIELRGAGADESPECYKRLDEVLAYHGNTVRVLHTLKPIGVAMAGRDVVDPFKD